MDTNFVPHCTTYPPRQGWPDRQPGVAHSEGLFDQMSLVSTRITFSSLIVLSFLNVPYLFLLYSSISLFFSIAPIKLYSTGLSLRDEWVLSRSMNYNLHYGLTQMTSTFVWSKRMLSEEFLAGKCSVSTTFVSQKGTPLLDTDTLIKSPSFFSCSFWLSCSALLCCSPCSREVDKSHSLTFWERFLKVLFRFSWLVVLQYSFWSLL